MTKHSEPASTAITSLAKASTSSESSSKGTLGNGASQIKQQVEEEGEKEEEGFEDEGGQGKENCFSWERSLKWTNTCTTWDEWKNNVKVGQMYGLLS